MRRIRVSSMSLQRQDPDSSIDHRVCAGEEYRWGVQPNRLRGLEVDDQLNSIAALMGGVSATEIGWNSSAVPRVH
jgi:hypothetical protein